MGARTKLNQAYVNGALIVAIVIGVLFNSWTLFGVALVYYLASSVHSGNIRLASGRTPRQR